MITEEEARKKWCPFTRMVCVTKDRAHEVLNMANFNRAVTEGEDGRLLDLRGTRCIASDCMAWEWGDYGKWSHCDIVAKSEAEAKHGLEGSNWQLESMRREADGIRRYTFVHAGKRGDCGLKRK